MGTAEFDLGAGVSADGLGNVYLSGYTAGDLGGPNAGGQDAYLGKYDSAGELQWIRQLGTSEDDRSFGVTADGLGNVYISGETEGLLGDQSFGGRDAFVSKYDSDGVLQWTHQIGTEQREFSRGISTDGLGNVYISGSTFGSLASPNAGRNDVFVSKVDSEGVLQWSRQFGTEFIDTSRAVAADGMGNIYVAGHTNGSTRTFADAFLAKYNAEGDPLWTRQLGTDEQDVGSAVAVDREGNVYLAGDTSGDLAGTNAGMSDGFLSQYDADGTLMWTRLLGGDSYDEINGVAVDEMGHVFVAGRARGSVGGPSAGSYDMLVAMYDSSGSLHWTRQLGTAGLDSGLAISADGLGSVYAAGNTDGALGAVHLGSEDFVLAKFSAVPEPPTLALCVFGFAWLIARQRGVPG